MGEDINFYFIEENPRHLIAKFGVMIASDDIEENLRLGSRDGVNFHLKDFVLILKRLNQQVFLTVEIQRLPFNIEN